MARVMLVVGASSGFGYSLAERLCQQGHRVYAAARRLDLMKPLETMGATLLQMDVCDDTSVKHAIDQLVATEQRIDVVYNNAGYGVYGCMETIDIEEAQRQFDVNVFGAARVTNAVLPIMRKQGDGRVIYTASLASYLTTPCSGWYAASKHAIKALAEALRMEVKPFGIQIIQIEPGPVNTSFEDVAFSDYDKRMSIKAYQPLTQSFQRYMQHAYATSPNSESTIQAMVHAGTARSPSAVYRTTRSAKVYSLVRQLLGRAFSEWAVLRSFSAK